MKRKPFKKQTPVTKIDATRAWLGKNKVFLEVLSIVLLPSAAVYVAIKANSIADSQTRIMEQQEMPRIEIRTNQVYNENNKLYDTEMLAVFNMGGKLANFKFRSRQFLQIGTYKRDMSGVDTLMIAADEYYVSGGVLTGSSEGLIYTIDNDHGDTSVFRLRNILINQHRGSCDIVSYAEISYTDIFDNDHFNYFKIGPGMGASKISEAKWQKYEDMHEMERDRYYVRETKLVDVLKRLPK